MPRIAQGPTEQRLINGDAEDHIDDHCMGEIFDAFETKNIAKLRSSLEALVMNMFDYDGDENE